MGESPYLAKICLLKAFIDRKGDSEQRGKQQRGERNGEYRDKIAGTVGPQGAQAKEANTLRIGNFHFVRLLIVSQFVRLQHGRYGAPSERFLRCV